MMRNRNELTLDSHDLIERFIALSNEDQETFVAKQDPTKLKSEMKKRFIALKVLMTARVLADNQGLMNFTAQFRNLLAFFDLDHPQLKADPGSSERRLLYNGEEGSIAAETTQKGYRLLHISDMGLFAWKRKMFHLNVDKDYNLVTQRTTTESTNQNPQTHQGECMTWNTLNAKEMKTLYAELKKEASYENLFGYDLLSAAMFCANVFWLLSYECCVHLDLLALIIVPLVLCLNLAIYAAVIPPALSLIALEAFIINPIKQVINSYAKDPAETFVEELFSVSPSP